MIFVLEGPDGVGKTTLGQFMAKKLDAKYLHLGYRWPDKMFEYHTAALRWAIRQKKDVIIDRWWPSEALYAAEYRNGSQWPMMGRMMDRVARKHAFMYIYCLPTDLVDYSKKFSELKELRPEMYDDTTGVAKRYRDLFFGNKAHVCDDNYTDFLTRSGGVYHRQDHIHYTIETWGDKLDMFTEWAVERANTWRLSQFQPALDPNNPNLLGHAATAQYLFVGDQVNPKFRNMAWPFYDYGHSSLYLTEALHRVPASEELFMWANAYNADGSPNELVNKLLWQYPKLKIICAGKKSLDHLVSQHHTIFEHINHPSHTRRFDGRVDKMREVLRHAIH
jgi:hypothetical protein